MFISLYSYYRKKILTSHDVYEFLYKDNKYNVKTERHDYTSLQLESDIDSKVKHLRTSHS